VIPSGQADPRPRVQLLRFTLGQVGFGVLASQIQALREYQELPGEPGACWFHTRLGFPDAPRYHAPTAALVSGTWLVLDAIEELLEVPLDAIRPFPSLVEPFSLRRGLWGVLPSHGRLILLVDLQQMLKLDTIAPLSPNDSSTRKPL
jgi:chemotaxis signal transduction protein